MSFLSTVIDRVDRVRRRLGRALVGESEQLAEPLPPVETQDRRDRADRLFEVLQLMEQDRNRWKELFFTQASEHVAAQAVLENSLERVGRICERLIASLNEDRKQRGLELFEMVELFKADDLEHSERYAEKLRAAVAKMPAQKT